MDVSSKSVNTIILNKPKNEEPPPQKKAKKSLPSQELV